MPQGDSWLEEAMARWEVPLLRTCFLLLGDAKLAEDAVQEAFVKAWRAHGRYRGEASEKTWLMRIAVNTCRDMRRGGWMRHVDKAVRLEDLPEPAVPFEPADHELTQAVLGLPQRLRQAVILRFYQGLGVGETAQALGVSRRTVQYRLAKAERMLKRSLEGLDDVE